MCKIIEGDLGMTALKLTIGGGAPKVNITLVPCAGGSGGGPPGPARGGADSGGGAAAGIRGQKDAAPEFGEESSTEDRGRGSSEVSSGTSPAASSRSGSASAGSPAAPRRAGAASRRAASGSPAIFVTWRSGVRSARAAVIDANVARRVVTPFSAAGPSISARSAARSRPLRCGAAVKRLVGP